MRSFIALSVLISLSSAFASVIFLLNKFRSTQGWYNDTRIVGSCSNGTDDGGAGNHEIPYGAMLRRTQDCKPA